MRFFGKIVAIELEVAMLKRIFFACLMAFTLIALSAPPAPVEAAAPCNPKERNC
jgi:hypothetical protein